MAQFLGKLLRNCLAWSFLVPILIVILILGGVAMFEFLRKHWGWFAILVLLVFAVGGQVQFGNAEESVAQEVSKPQTWRETLEQRPCPHLWLAQNTEWGDVLRSELCYKDGGDELSLYINGILIQKDFIKDGKSTQTFPVLRKPKVEKANYRENIRNNMFRTDI